MSNQYKSYLRYFVFFSMCYYLFFLTSMGIYDVPVIILWHICGGERLTLRNWFSSSTMVSRDQTQVIRPV